MTDFFMLGEIQKMIKSMPKPRLLLKKGITVRGFFRPYMSLRDYTRAKIFKDQDEITPVTVRFASMLGDRGTADTRRNIKSMAVKFHSYDKVYDMICQNIPVLMTNDVSKITEVFDIYRIHSSFDGIDKAKFWNYIRNHEESLTFALMLFSHMGISDTLVNINMFAVNTYRWLNDDYSSHLIRYKWVPSPDPVTKTPVKHRSMTVNAAEFIAGYDPDRAFNEIITSILNKNYPVFELHVQMIKINRTISNIYTDSTLIWNENLSPYMCVGAMVLDQIDEDAADDDSVFFLPGNTIDGIELHDDEMSQIMDFIFRTEAMERGVYI